MQTLNRPAKTITAPCDGGQCLGTITLVTDGAVLGYALVQPAEGSGFIEQDCDEIEVDADGTITVRCAAAHTKYDVRCEGSATFTPTALAATEPADAPLAHALHVMDEAA